MNRSIICKLCGNAVLSESVHDFECDQCGYISKKVVSKTSRVTLSYSLSALVLYVPALLFPFMTMELYGRKNSSTLWGGIVSLAESGSMPIAIIVFVASIFIPILKLLILFYLSLTTAQKKHQRFKTRLYRFVEAIGRWSMLDIFVLAVLVAIIKLGPWTTVRPELGSLLFAAVVILTMIASSSFDPRLIWRKKDE